MSNPIYGHELLDILSDVPSGCTRGQLRELAAARFGGGAVYTNCSGILFDFDGVLAFLASRGKVALNGERVALGTVPGCAPGAHDEHDHHDHLGEAPHDTAPMS